MLLKMLPRTRLPAVPREVYPAILCPRWNGPGSLLGRAPLSVLPGSPRASVSPTLLIAVAFLVQTWSPPPATLAAPARPGGAERWGPCRRSGSRIRDAPAEDWGGGPGSDPDPRAARKPAESWGGGLSPRSGRGSWARAAWVGRERIARQLLPVGRAEGRAEGARKSHGEGAGCDRLCGRVGARP